MSILPHPLTPEEKRIAGHVVFVGTWIAVMAISLGLFVGIVQTARSQYASTESRLTSLEVKGDAREAALSQLRAEIILIRARQDEVIWGQQKMYGFGAGMVCLISILSALTGANWLKMRGPKR